jgi:hypothetical protein
LTTTVWPISKCHRLGHLEPRAGDIGALAGLRRPPAQHARRRHQARQILGRRDHLDPVRLELVGDAAQQLVVVQRAHAGEERRAAQIGPEAVEQPRLLDAARHHRALAAGLLQGANHLVELADTDQRAGRDLGLELGLGLADVRDRNHLDPGLARATRDQAREDPVAGDQPETRNDGRHLRAA